jgi:hypothetical protein
VTIVTIIPDGRRRASRTEGFTTCALTERALAELLAAA